MAVATYIEIIDCNDAYFPEYPTVTAFVYYMNGTEKVPIKHMRMDFWVKSEDTHDTKNDGSETDGYVLMRRDYTDRNGMINFQIFPFLTWSSGLEWDDRRLSPKVVESTDGKISVNSNIDWNASYVIAPKDKSSNKKYDCKITFADETPSEINFDTDPISDRIFEVSTITTSVGWWKCATDINLLRCNGIFNPTNKRWYLEKGNPEKCWIFLSRKTDSSDFGLNGALFSNQTINYSIDFRNSVNVTLSNTISNNATETHSFSGSTASYSLKLTDGKGWVEIPHPSSLSSSTPVTLTFTYGGNTFFASSTLSLLIQWNSLTNTYRFETATVTGDVYNSSTQTVEGKIVTSNGAVASNKTFNIVYGNSTGSFKTGSDGTFSYPLTDLPITDFQTIYLDRCVIKDENSTIVGDANTICINKYEITKKDIPSDNLTVFSKKTAKLNLKKNGELFSGTVRLKVEYSRDSRDWDEGRYYCFYDNELQSENGIISYNFSEIYKEYKDTETIHYDEDEKKYYINKYSDTSIKYAGVYKFTFEYASNNEKGCQYSFTKKFTNIDTHFEYTNANNGAKEYDTSVYYVGMNCQIVPTLVDANDVEVPSGLITKYMIPSTTVNGTFSTKDKEITLEPNKEYNNRGEGRIRIFMSKHGRADIPFRPLSKGDMYYTYYFKFHPDETPDYSDVYNECENEGKLWWKKKIINLSKPNKTVYVNQQAELTPKATTWWDASNIPLIGMQVDGAASKTSVPVKGLQVKSVGNIVWETLEGNSTTGSGNGTLTNTTSVDGIAPLSYTSTKGDVKGTFTFKTIETDIYAESEPQTVTVRWNKYTTSFALSDMSSDVYVTKQGYALVQLTYNNGTTDVVLKSMNVKRELNLEALVEGKETSDGDTITKKNITLTSTDNTAPTNTNGNVSAKYYVTSKGNIKGTFKFTFDGTDAYRGTSITTDAIEWKKFPTTLTKNSDVVNDTGTDTCSADVKMTYGPSNKVLANKQIDTSIRLSTSTDTIPLSQSTTNNNGVASASYTIEEGAGITGNFIFKFNGDDLYEASNTYVSDKVTWSGKLRLSIIKDSHSTKIYVNEEGYSKVKIVKNSDNTPVAGVKIKAELTFYDIDKVRLPSNSLLPDKKTFNLTSDDDGYVDCKYTNTTLGNVYGKFNFELANSSLYAANAEYEEFGAFWWKIPTELKITRNTSNNGHLDVTKKGTVEITAYNTRTSSKITTAESITRSISFEPINTGDTLKFTPPTLSNKNLNESGKAGTTHEPTVQGDIIGTFKFKLENNNIYADSEASDDITWHKLQTKINSFDTTIYNGRYTNIVDGEPSWNTKSDGVNEDYTNFKAELMASYEYCDDEDKAVEGRTIHAKQGDVQRFDYNATDTNGIALQRWTTTISKPPITRTYTNVFDGDDIYKASESTFQFKILARITTVLTKYTEILYPTGYRYNVPFHFGAYLKTEDGEILNKQKVKFGVNDTTLRTEKTDSNGLAYIPNYSHGDVGTVTMTADFDENDEIDKYLPASLTYEITVQKDNTSLTITRGTAVYTSCDDAQLTCKLVDSLDRVLVNEDLYIQYDDGTYSDAKWLDFEDGKITTDSNGEAKYFAKAYSGIRLIKGIYNGSWCYKSTNAFNEIEYDITRTYNIPVTNGVAEGVIDCIKKPKEGGFPEGLYDIEIEYLPPDTETGKCTLYGSSSILKPVRKKKSTYLTKMTPRAERTVESKCPVLVTAKLTDEYDNPMPNEQIHTHVNNLYPSYPYHLTDENGLVVRGNRNDIIDEIYVIHFQFNQTRDRIGAMLDVNTYTTKITPKLVPTVDPVTTYSGVEVPLKALFYELRYKYALSGYEVKRMPDYKQIHYNKLESYLGNAEYYLLVGDTKIPATEDDYNNASHVDLKKLLPDKTVTWSNSSGDKIFGTDTTNKNGLASTTFVRKTAGRYTIYLTTEEDDTYFATRVTQYIDVLPKIKPYFEEIDFTQTANHVVYGHNVSLGTHLYYKENDTQIAFKNQDVVFTQGSTTLGKVKTNSSGYAKIENYTVANYPTLAYKVEFTGYNQYENASMTYTVPVDKQTPILTLSSSKTTATIGDTITLTAKLTSDNATSNKALNGMNIVFYDGTKSIGTVKTNSGGIATISYKLTSAGTSKPFSAKYTTTSDSGYDTAEKTIQIKVNKIATHFESPDGAEIEIPGGTSQKYSLILKDANNNALLAKPVTISYNGNNTSVNSDNSGKVTIETGKQEKGVTKQATFTFAGDDNYQNCTYNLSIKWGEYPDDEDCRDLDAFDTLLENWYASDGTAKYGIDAATGKYKIDSTPILDTRGSPSCRKNGRTGLCLRCICNDLKEEGTYDADDDCVSAPTGVILRSKKLVTSSKCSVTFYFQIKYNGASDSISKNLYGGHFGLMSSSATTAESAPLRFEMYRRNVYVISNGGNAVYSNLRYSMDANKKYYVKWDIDGKKFSVTIYDENMNEIKKSQSFTAQSTLEGLHPYCFAYTNGTSFVLSHINIKRE